MIELLFALVLALNPDRGAFLAALPHPTFPVERAHELLKESPKPSIGVLYGTFGTSPKNLHVLLDMLGSSGHVGRSAPRVRLYVTCGPCRRPRRNGGLEHFRPDLDIKQFNDTVRGREGPRAKRRLLRQWDARVRSLLSRWVASYPDIEFQLFVELEDNLNPASRRVLQRHTATLIADYFNVTQATNSLKGERGYGPLEVHTLDWSTIHTLRPGDIVSMDGVTDAASSRLVGWLLAHGISFMAWDAPWQGIDPSNPNLGKDERTYNLSHLRPWRKLLRGE